MADSTVRRLADSGMVEGARPYGLAGVIPQDAVVTGIRPHGRGVPYISDAPYFVPYNERAQCDAIKRNGDRCGGKARTDGPLCDAHQALVE